MKKKLLVLVMAVAMVLAFTACGGGSSDSGSGSSEQAPAAEANTGCGGIVYAVPDGWTMTEANPGDYSRYDIPGSEYHLAVSVFNEKSLKDYNEWRESEGNEVFESIDAYYDQNCNLSDDEFKKRNLEHSTFDVCGTEGIYTKYSGGKDGFYELGTSWLYDDAVYQMFMYTDAAYGEDGQLTDEAVPLTDEEIASFEAVLASIQPGDGTPYQKAALEESSKSIGSITYDIPDGYTVSNVSDRIVEFQKEGSEVVIQVSYTDEENLSNIEFNGKNPSSLQELYEMSSYEGMESMTIAGFDGHIDKWTDEDEKYHNISASFLADDAVYDVYMGDNAYDNDGNLKADAEGLSEEDLAAFDAFLASLRKK